VNSTLGCFLLLTGPGTIFFSSMLQFQFSRSAWNLRLPHWNRHQNKIVPLIQNKLPTIFNQLTESLSAAMFQLYQWNSFQQKHHSNLLKINSMLPNLINQQSFKFCTKTEKYSSWNQFLQFLIQLKRLCYFKQFILQFQLWIMAAANHYVTASPISLCTTKFINQQITESNWNFCKVML